MNQIASALSYHPKGVGREHCNIITLHSGKHVEVKEKLDAEESKLVSSRVPNLNTPVGYERAQTNSSFSQRLNKNHVDPYFQKFLGMLI